MTTQQFPYVESDGSLGAASALPYMPISLTCGEQELSVSALVDSGAALNVLPYSTGVQLGATWDEQTIPVNLSGNLAASEARALLVTGRVAGFPPVRLAFGWSRSDNAPVILGQVNFFMEFDVLFRRSQMRFEIQSKGTSASS